MFLLIINLIFSVYCFNRANDLIDKSKKQNHRFVLETIVYLDNYFTLLSSYSKNDDYEVQEIKKNYLLMKKMSDNINPLKTGIFLNENSNSIAVYETIHDLTEAVSLMRVNPPLFLADLGRVKRFKETHEELNKFLCDFSKDIRDLRDSLDYEEIELKPDNKEKIIEAGNEIIDNYWNWRKNHLDQTNYKMYNKY